MFTFAAYEKLGTEGNAIETVRVGYRFKDQQPRCFAETLTCLPVRTGNHFSQSEIERNAWLISSISTPRRTGCVGTIKIFPIVATSRQDVAKLLG